MPLIPPRFPNNNTSSTTPSTKPPWVRGPQASNSPQNNDVAPWRRNLKSVPPPGANKSPVPVPTEETSVSPSPPPTATEQAPQQKTSKLQINLKSVKKPDAPAKAIPIPIPIQVEQNGSAKPTLTTTIPIQKQKEVPGKSEEEKQTTAMPKSGGPPPPPPPPGPPPPPPPADGLNLKQQKIEMLRKGAKRRPDWAGMMKEIEKGRVLNHVECNDRSKPMISRLKCRGKFVYESEAKPASKSDALHNRILNEIQQGVKLKRVHCNDRSKPILTGLRVRRQSSVMEGETLLPMETSVDELAYIDIDVLRDELQSAKQMLSAEVESKHNLEKKTRDQKCHIIAMEAEIEMLKAKLGIIPEEEVSLLARNLEKSDSKTFKHLRKSGSSLWKSPSGVKKSKSGLAKQSPSDTNVNKLDQNAEEELAELNEYEEEIASLKDAVQHARKQAEEMEQKFKEATEKLQNVQNSFEESEQKRKALEKQVEIMETEEGRRLPLPVIQTAERTTQTEAQILERMDNLARQQSTASNADYDSEEEESDEDMEVDETSVQKKKQERELKLWENKLKSVKDKEGTSRVERKNLKSLQKKLEEELKEANKRHKKLQKEVDKMAKMMDKMAREVEKDEDDEDEEDEEEEEEEEEAETDEEESEEEETESDTDEDEADASSEEDDENASYEDRLALFGKRVKKRENVLNAMRKGNYLLRANIDRLKDELEDARIAYHDLEHELNAVLDET